MVSSASAAHAIAGQWRRKDSARATQALLSADAAGMLAVSALDVSAPLASGHVSSVAVSERVGSIPRTVTFADGSVFETRDNDAVDRLVRARSGRGAGFIHEMERFRPRLILFAALVVALGFGIYRYAVPVLVEVAIVATPPIVPKLMSQSALASLDRTLFEKSGLPEERQKSLASAFQALEQHAADHPDGRPAPSYTLNFRKGGAIGPNAFALPDGTLVLTDELVELASDDELILGVLAHEIGHVDHEHSLRQLYRAAGATALIMMIGGDIGGGTEDILIQGSSLAALSYSRGAEAEADRFSVELMHRAGHDPAAIARFFELLQQKFGPGGDGGFFATHPATPERIAATRAYAQQIAAGE